MQNVKPQLDFKHKFHSRYYEQCGKFRVGNSFNKVETNKVYEKTDLIKYGVIEFVKDVMFE